MNSPANGTEILCATWKFRSSEFFEQSRLQHKITSLYLIVSSIPGSRRVSQGGHGKVSEMATFTPKTQ